MDDRIPQWRLLMEVTRRMLKFNPHLLARWPCPAAGAARQEDESESGALRLRYGNANEKKVIGSECNQR